MQITRRRGGRRGEDGSIPCHSSKFTTQHNRPEAGSQGRLDPLAISSKKKMAGALQPRGASRAPPQNRYFSNKSRSVPVWPASSLKPQPAKIIEFDTNSDAFLV